jgi:hypothetical protein
MTVTTGVGNRVLIPQNGRLYETVELWNTEGRILLLVVYYESIK